MTIASPAVVEEMLREDGGDPDLLMTPGEVALVFRVDPKTITRWALAGRISFVRTVGGHRRYRQSEVRRLLAEGKNVQQPKAGTERADVATEA